jgi:hypothetical protein
MLEYSPDKRNLEENKGKRITSLKSQDIKSQTKYTIFKITGISRIKFEK